MKIIVDIDGTITDARHRAHLIPADVTRTENWVAYNAASKDDLPRETVINLVNDLKECNDIAFLTSRGEAARQVTRHWLRTNVSYFFDPLILRAMHDHSPSIEYKRRWFEYLKPDLIIEDCPKICEMARGLGITVLQIDSMDPYVIATGSTGK